jgi:putative peptidoglycan lipid II flippase
MVNQAKRLLGKANQRQTVGTAALVISMAYLLSRLLGLLRDRLLVAHFGVGSDLSAYYAAFRLPELLFTLLVSGAFAVAFIPVLTEHLEKDQRDQAWRVASSLLNILVLVTVAGGIIGIIFADPLTWLLAPGFDAHTHELTANLTRIMMITPVMFAISSVLGSIQQAFNRFLIFALAGVLYNVGIILGIVFWAGHFGIYGVAFGVVVGVIIQAIFQWAGLYGLGFRYRPEINFRLTGVTQTLKLMLPRSIDQVVDQLNYAVETVIGSVLGKSAIANFTLASNLKNVPLVLIASSITTAVFPTLAARAAKGQREELIEGYVRTARLILFLAIPSAIFAYVARGYIVRLLYGFGSNDTANTLGWFAGTIIFASLFQLVARVYYAMQDTKTPLIVSLVSIPINIALSFALSRPFGVAGLAMSASLVAALETTVLLIILRRREGNFGEGEIIRGAIPMVLSGLIMTGVLYWTVSRLLPLYAVDHGFMTLAPKFAVIVVIGTAAYLIPCYMLKLKEANVFVTRVKEQMIRSFNIT